MNYWLTQLILAARNRDRDSSWVQILFFVILSVFWALGSIIKAKSNKTAKKGKEQTPLKPERKPKELTVDLRILKQLFGLPEEESISQPSSEEAEPRASKTRITRPQVRPIGRKVVRPVTKRSAITKPRPEERKTSIEVPKIDISQTKPSELVETPQVKYLSEILSDYENPESLRRAILHYEILGKPISLRESTEHLF